MISIIIPTLNEERSLPPLLDTIRKQGTGHEVIVVDGGSQDRTLDVARNHGVRTLLSPPGRGLGICIGAAGSSGGVSFFLHADSTLLPGALNRISEVLSADAKIIGGNFHLVFDGDTPFSRWLTGFYAWIRSVGLYYGDSGIFVRRSVYESNIAMTYLWESNVDRLESIPIFALYPRVDRCGCSWKRLENKYLACGR